MKSTNLPKQTEAQITKSIRRVLEVCGIWHFKHWSGAMTHPKGISDILGIFRGRFLAIEVKRPGLNLTEHQTRFIERVNAEGGIGFKAYSTQDVIEKLDLRGRFLL